MTARLAWWDLPDTLQLAIEAELGFVPDRVTGAIGGYSPGFVAQIASDDGRRAFVKAMSRVMHPGWVFLYEREARIAPALPDGPPFPRWRWTVDDGDWIALGFDVIDGREPRLPWPARDVDRVLAAHLAMAQALDPSPTPVERAHDVWGDAFMRWGAIAHDGQVARRLPGRWERHLEELAEIEGTWPAHTQGDHLVHLDLRADNILLSDDVAGDVTGDVVFVVDWAFAARGQPWMDLVCLLPNVAMRGGPDPEAVWRAHPWHARTDPHAFDAFLAGWTGMLTHLALVDASPGLRDLQQLHAEQAAEARRWLAHRLRWDDVEV